jgi:hypothetical protein
LRSTTMACPLCADFLVPAALIIAAAFLFALVG